MDSAFNQRLYSGTHQDAMQSSSIWHSNTPMAPWEPGQHNKFQLQLPIGVLEWGTSNGGPFKSPVILSHRKINIPPENHWLLMVCLLPSLKVTYCWWFRNLAITNIWMYKTRVISWKYVPYQLVSRILSINSIKSPFRFSNVMLGFSGVLTAGLEDTQVTDL